MEKSGFIYLIVSIRSLRFTLFVSMFGLFVIFCHPRVYQSTFPPTCLPTFLTDLFPLISLALFPQPPLIPPSLPPLRSFLSKIPHPYRIILSTTKPHFWKSLVIVEPTKVTLVVLELESRV